MPIRISWRIPLWKECLKDHNYSLFGCLIIRPTYVASLQVSSPNSPCRASRVLRCSLGSDRFTQGVGKLDARVRVCVTAGQRRASIVTEPSRESVISVQGPQHSRNTNQFTPWNTNTPHTHSILLRLIQLILEWGLIDVPCLHEWFSLVPYQTHDVYGGSL